MARPTLIELDRWRQEAEGMASEDLRAEVDDLQRDLDGLDQEEYETSNEAARKVLKQSAFAQELERREV